MSMQPLEDLNLWKIFFYYEIFSPFFSLFHAFGENKYILKNLLGRWSKLEQPHWLCQMLPEDITFNFSCTMKIRGLVPVFSENHFYSGVF